MEQIRTPSHCLTLTDRKSLTVTGVTEVVGFDETAVVIHTVSGTLTLEGQDLKLKNLSREQILVEGTIQSLSYGEESSAGGFWHRLFS